MNEENWVETTKNEEKFEENGEAIRQKVRLMGNAVRQ